MRSVSCWFFTIQEGFPGFDRSFTHALTPANPGIQTGALSLLPYLLQASPKPAV